MRVLYVLAHFPQRSESYVDAEMAYVRSQGVQVEVWSPMAGYGDVPTVQIHRGSLADAIKGFSPDVIHIHHMTTSDYYLDNCPKGRVTVRAHSFDWDLDRVKRVAQHPAVRRLFAFPHLAESIPGVVSLPVAYDTKHYYRSMKKYQSVVRLSAGLLTKRLEDFLIVGNELHTQADFALAINFTPGKEASVSDTLAKLNASLGGHVRILKNLSKDDAAELTRRAAVYMHTYDHTSHPFGMPISIAEAMATGALVLARSNGVGVHAYMGDAGLFYSSTEEAKKIIQVALAMSEQERDGVADVSCRVAERFRPEVVLPRLLEEWESIRSGKSTEGIASC